MTKTLSISSKTIRKLTTPQLLKGGLYLTWGASLLLLIATISGVQGQRNAIKTVGKDSAPSIITAQRVKDALAGMDANAVNELIAKPGENSDAFKGYEERREKLAERLVAAAQNITYEPERKPILTLQLALGEYIAKIQEARDAHQRGDANGTLAAYREAIAIMDNTLLPAADELDKVNQVELGKSYAEQQLTSGGSLFLVVISGLLLIGILVALQLFLNHRMRRMLNPWLLTATAIAVIFLGYTTRALLGASHNLKVATKDAFVSVHALRQARALAYSANSDESRYLLDKAFAAQHEQNFFAKAAQLAKIPEGQTFEAVAADTAQGQKVNGFTGFLADALNNITFTGEREAAVQTLSTFGTYFTIDKQIRQLERSGKHAQAIALCIGDKPGQSNWAFNQFLDAHQKTLDINVQAFDETIEQGFKEVEGFEVTAPVVTAAIALLTLFGLLPRLKEYSA